jgi:hypothetical protein
MKLITEYNDNLECSIVESAGGERNFVIEGIFMQANQKNRNGRVYESSIMHPAVDKYITEQVSTGRAVGELNHPESPSINLDKVSHRITELRWDGDDVYGKAQILNTPMGQVVKGLLEGGVKLGVSSRGMGSLERRDGGMYVGKDFHLATVDIVQDPSAPSAFVNGIMEGVDYYFDGDRLVAQEADRVRNIAKTMSTEQLAEHQIRLFKNFLNAITAD